MKRLVLLLILPFVIFESLCKEVFRLFYNSQFRLSVKTAIKKWKGYWDEN